MDAMADTAFWIYELPEARTRLVGTSPEEIKAVFPYLEARHGLDFETLKEGPYYEVERMIINYLAPPDKNLMLAITVAVRPGVRVRFNPASYLELIRESREAYERRICDLFVFKSMIFDSETELFLPGYIAHSLKAHPWEAHARTVERLLSERASKESLDAHVRAAMENSGSEFKH